MSKSRSVTCGKYNKVDEDEDDVEDLAVIPARLHRGFSRTNNNIVLIDLARDFMLKDISEEGEDFFAEKTEFTFALPSLEKYPENFKAFLFKELVESSMLVSLEQEGHLNWWTDMGICDRLLPMVTSGDGNCLLHAASLAMWGFHDRVLALRGALNTVMTKSSHLASFRSRWRHQQSEFLRACDLVLSEEEWLKEWDLLVKVTTLEPRNGPWIDKYTPGKQFGGGSINNASAVSGDAVYESLEEFHVFVLCHVIKRPIIVIASPFLKNIQGEAFSPVPFRGIYLPLERSPKECCSSPLLLAYNLGHFCSLAPMDAETLKTTRSLTIPLVDSEMNLLPIHFASSLSHPYDPTYDEKLALLRRYLEVEFVPTRTVQDHCLIDLDDDSNERRAFGPASVFYHSDSPQTSSKGEQEGVNVYSEQQQVVARRRRSSVQSTKFVRQLDGQTGSEGSTKVIMCCKLNIKKTPFAKELVTNYLDEAQRKFSGMSHQKGKQMEEIRRRSKDGVQLKRIGQPIKKNVDVSSSKEDFQETSSSRAKPFQYGTLPSLKPQPKTVDFTLGEQYEDLVRNPANVTGRVVGGPEKDCRMSAPVRGYFDKQYEVPSAGVGLYASYVEKKDPPGTFKTLQKLFGQNKVKFTKSTFYHTSDLVRRDTLVSTGKSKFYAIIDEMDGKSDESCSSNSLPSKPTVKLPAIDRKDSSAHHHHQSHDNLREETNFSTFPSRSTVSNRWRQQGTAEGDTSSLPKMKLKDYLKSGKVEHETSTSSHRFTSSTSDPNLFEAAKSKDSINPLKNLNNNNSNTDDYISNSSNIFPSSISSTANRISLLHLSEEQQQGNRQNVPTGRPQALPCKTDGCTFFGSWQKGGYCSVCFAEKGDEDHVVTRGKSKSGTIPAASLKYSSGLGSCRTKL